MKISLPLRRIKLFVVLCFALSIFAAFIYRPTSVATGTAAGEPLGPPTGLTASDSDYVGSPGTELEFAL